jgi:phage-related protein
MKPVFWIGDSREEIHEFPDDVQKLIGYALHLAQSGDKHPRAKPLQGFQGAGVLEPV